MSQNVKAMFVRHELVEKEGQDRRQALMRVEFQGDDGNVYDWWPKWRDVCEIFRQAVLVERANNPLGSAAMTFLSVHLAGAFVLANDNRVRGEHTLFMEHLVENGRAFATLSGGETQEGGEPEE